MKYKIISEEIVFDSFFKIKKAKIEHDAFNKSEAINITRLCFERGDSVAILILEKDTNSLLFTNQFRYPTTQKDNGWIVELTAGSLNINEDPKTCAIREVEEEIGYKIDNLEFINTCYVSPGGSSEKIHLFFTEVNSTNKTFKGGGLESEKEDIELIKIPISEIKEKLNSNFFKDAKTIIALQWLLINKSI